MKYAYQLLSGTLLVLSFAAALPAQNGVTVDGFESGRVPVFLVWEITGLGGDTCINSMNNNQQLVGDTKTTDGSTKAFRWDSDGTTTQLGSVPGYLNTSAAWIDFNGDIYGSAWNTPTDQQAYSYQNLTAAWRPVSFPPSSVAAVANGLGSIGGYSSASGLILPYIEQNGTPFQVPTPYSPSEGSWVTGLNSANQYIGNGNLITPGGFKADYDGSNWTSQRLDNAPWGKETFAYSVNYLGNVAGTAYVTNTEYRAVLWPNPGAPIDLGTLVGGNRSEGYSINGVDTVVGYATDSSGSPRAAVFEGNTVSDVTPSPLSFAYATAINDLGQIGVCGKRTPVSPTSAWVLNPATPAAKSLFLMHGFVSVPEVMFVAK